MRNIGTFMRNALAAMTLVIGLMFAGSALAGEYDKCEGNGYGTVAEMLDVLVLEPNKDFVVAQGEAFDKAAEVLATNLGQPAAHIKTLLLPIHEGETVFLYADGAGNICGFAAVDPLILSYAAQAAKAAGADKTYTVMPDESGDKV